MSVVAWALVKKGKKNIRSQKHNSFATDTLYTGKFDALKSILF